MPGVGLGYGVVAVEMLNCLPFLSQSAPAQRFSVDYIGGNLSANNQADFLVKSTEDSMAPYVSGSTPNAFKLLMLASD